ncbi:hypothetical protein JHW43_004437 [Diplocarpon mali]|nr:hypothetical protein JHW43_004437 [Diplocarpon mali]
MGPRWLSDLARRVCSRKRGRMFTRREAARTDSCASSRRHIYDLDHEALPRPSPHGRPLTGQNPATRHTPDAPLPRGVARGVRRTFKVIVRVHRGFLGTRTSTPVQTGVKVAPPVEDSSGRQPLRKPEIPLEERGSLGTPGAVARIAGPTDSLFFPRAEEQELVRRRCWTLETGGGGRAACPAFLAVSNSAWPVTVLDRNPSRIPTDAPEFSSSRTVHADMAISVHTPIGQRAIRGVIYSAAELVNKQRPQLSAANPEPVVLPILQTCSEFGEGDANKPHTRSENPSRRSRERGQTPPQQQQSGDFPPLGYTAQPVPRPWTSKDEQRAYDRRSRTKRSGSHQPRETMAVSSMETRTTPHVLHGTDGLEELRLRVGAAKQTRAPSTAIHAMAGPGSGLRRSKTLLGEYPVARKLDGILNVFCWGVVRSVAEDRFVATAYAHASSIREISSSCSLLSPNLGLFDAMPLILSTNMRSELHGSALGRENGSKIRRRVASRGQKLEITSQKIVEPSCGRGDE